MDHQKNRQDAPSAPILDKGLEARLAEEARRRELMETQRDYGDETREP